MLRQVLDQAKGRNIRTLIGVYRPSNRNVLVENHYENLGFSLLERQADGATIWKLDVASAQVQDAPMRIRSIGFSAGFSASAPQLAPTEVP